jgi:D-alanine-D-alanine ligase
VGAHELAGRQVAVVFGGPSPEHDVSVLTGLEALRELVASRPGGVVAHGLYWSKAGSWHFVAHEDAGVLEAEAFLEGPPRGALAVELVACESGGFVRRRRFGREPIQLDALLVCCHGGPGEDGTLQGALDLAGLRYSGPGVAAAALGMDKLAFAAFAVAHGMPVLPRRLLEADTDSVGFEPPYVVKPRFGGSSIGVEVVADLATAKHRLASNPHLRRGAVIEPYDETLDDLNVAVRTWPRLQLSALERPLRPTGASGGILGYEDKYVRGEGMAAARREVPARVAPELGDRARTLARVLAGRMGLRGVARVDFLTDGERLFVNEVNTIPGSLARHLFVDPAVAFAELLLGLIEEAIAVPAARHDATGAEGTVLRSARAIAAKLG